MWWQTSNCSPLLIYRPPEDERLSWPGWLTYSGRLTHISGHPSATGRVQDGERTLARDWRSTAESRGPTKKSWNTYCFCSVWPLWTSGCTSIRYFLSTKLPPAVKIIGSSIHQSWCILCLGFLKSGDLKSDLYSSTMDKPCRKSQLSE